MANSSGYKYDYWKHREFAIFDIIPAKINGKPVNGPVIALFHRRKVKLVPELHS